MPAMEVLGVEIAQYTAPGAEAFVPRVVGQSDAARGAKRAPGGKADEATFFDASPDD